MKLLSNGDFILSNLTTLVDSSIDLNCIQEGLIPSKFFEKIIKKLRAVDENKLEINYKLSSIVIYQDDICLQIPFLLVKILTRHHFKSTISYENQANT